MEKVLLKDFVFSEEMQGMYDIKVDEKDGMISFFKPMYITIPIAECEVKEDEVVIDLESDLFKFTLWKRHAITHMYMYKPVCS